MRKTIFYYILVTLPQLLADRHCYRKKLGMLNIKLEVFGRLLPTKVGWGKLPPICKKNK
jgi:hypothetical protein